MGTKERKERELAERKQLIIDRSKELFFEHGFNNVSVNDICKAVEYGQSAIYSIFSSKEEIYGYIYVEAMAILADLITGVDKSVIKPENAFELFTIEIYKFYSEYNSYYTALFFMDSDSVALSKLSDYQIKAKYVEKERAMEPVREVLKVGIDNGVLMNMDIDQTINTYFASLLGIINTFVIESMLVGDFESKASLKNILIDHARIYERGLMRG